MQLEEPFVSKVLNSPNSIMVITYSETLGTQRRTYVICSITPTTNKELDTLVVVC